VVSAYNTAKNSLTRSPANIITKNAAKRAMIVEARQLAGVIQKFPTITNTQRSELGLTVPNTPSPVPVPSSQPAMEITSVSGWTVSLRLHDSTSGTKRGKPAGVSGASLFSFVGAIAPAEIALWKFEGSTGRTKINVSFDSSNAPGTKVWLTAFWFNNRKRSGPACDPISTNLQGGSVSMAIGDWRALIGSWKSAIGNTGVSHANHSSSTISTAARACEAAGGGAGVDASDLYFGGSADRASV
jgi:hypothetical protein